MAKKDENGNWLDSRNNPVPPKYVGPVEKRRDQVVERIHAKAADLEARMRKVKTDVLQEVAEYLHWLEKQTGVERKGKGNVTLTSFSGNLQVEISMDDVVAFDERLQSAKALIDECIVEWSEGSSEQIVVLVQAAFNVDKNGKVNMHQILRLLKLAIKDERWNQAMDIIRESLQIKATRQYLNLLRREKNAETGSEQWVRINLNFSAM